MFLETTSLTEGERTVGYLMHAPIQIHIEDVEQMIPSFLMPVATDAIKEI